MNPLNNTPPAASSAWKHIEQPCSHGSWPKPTDALLVGIESNVLGPSWTDSGCCFWCHDLWTPSLWTGCTLKVRKVEQSHRYWEPWTQKTCPLSFSNQVEARTCRGLTYLTLKPTFLLNIDLSFFHQFPVSGHFVPLRITTTNNASADLALLWSATFTTRRPCSNGPATGRTQHRPAKTVGTSRPIDKLCATTYHHSPTVVWTWKQTTCF